MKMKWETYLNNEKIIKKYKQRLKVFVCHAYKDTSLFSYRYVSTGRAIQCGWGNHPYQQERDFLQVPGTTQTSYLSSSWKLKLFNYATLKYPIPTFK